MRPRVAVVTFPGSLDDRARGGAWWRHHRRCQGDRGRRGGRGRRGQPLGRRDRRHQRWRDMRHQTMLFVFGL